MANPSFNAFSNTLVVWCPVRDECTANSASESDVVFPCSVVAEQIGNLVWIRREVAPGNDCVGGILEVVGRHREFHGVNWVVDGNVIQHAESRVNDTSHSSGASVVCQVRRQAVNNAVEALFDNAPVDRLQDGICDLSIGFVCCLVNHCLDVIIGPLRWVITNRGERIRHNSGFLGTFVFLRRPIKGKCLLLVPLRLYSLCIQSRVVNDASALWCVVGCSLFHVMDINSFLQERIIIKVVSLFAASQSNPSIQSLTVTYTFVILFISRIHLAKGTDLKNNKVSISSRSEHKNYLPRWPWRQSWKRLRTFSFF